MKDDPSPLEADKKALAEGDRERVSGLLTPLAARGDSEAQYHLGQLFLIVQGGGFDVAEAIRWYNAAAAQGHVFATHALAELYNPSVMRDPRFRVPQDAAKSRNYYLACLGGLQDMALTGDAEGRATRPNPLVRMSWGAERRGSHPLVHGLLRERLAMCRRHPVRAVQGHRG